MNTQVIFNSTDITLEQVKSFVRVEGSQDDNLLEMLLAGAVDEFLSYTGTAFGSFTCNMITTFSNTVIITWPAQNIEIIEVVVNSVVIDESLYIWRPSSFTLEIDSSVTGSELNIKYSCGETPTPADVRNAIFQNVKFNYDFGDNLPEQRPRFFDKVAFRYKTPGSFLGE